MVFKGRALVMDDEEYILEVERYILQNIGCEVSCVSNGENALIEFEKAFRSNKRFDVIILDLTIPSGIGGLGALKEIMKIDPQAIVIATSGYSEDPVMKDPKHYGFAGKIAKPFTKNNVAEILNKILFDSECNK